MGTSLEDRFPLFYQFIYIGGTFYILTALVLVVYGVWSIVKRSTILHYEEGVYPRGTFHKKLTVLSSVLKREFDPIFSLRLIPRQVRVLFGSSAVLVGFSYFLLGVFMLTGMAVLVILAR